MNASKKRHSSKSFQDANQTIRSHLSMWTMLWVFLRAILILIWITIALRKFLTASSQFIRSHTQCGQARGGDYVLCSVLCTVYSPLLNPNPAKLNMQEDSRQPITGGEMRIIRMAIGPSGLTFAALMTFVFRLSPRSFQVLFMK